MMDNIDEVVELKPLKKTDKKVYKCAICGLQTLHKTNLQKHKKTHLAPEERKLFACIHCDKKYTAKENLRRHIEDNHIDSRSKNLQENIHKCSLCGYQTRHVAYFRQHQNIHLTLEERQMFVCAHCDKKFTQKINLRYHIDRNICIDSRSKDARKNLHKCSICGYQTPKIWHFQRHQKIHLTLDERQLFACAYCDKKYTAKQKLKFHLDANHIDSRSKDAQKNIHKCSICGYQTPYISYLQRHQEIHVAPDERQLFACAHCDKKYTRKRRLKVHLANHIDSRSKAAPKNIYKCSICGYQTPYIPRLQRHQAIHLAPDERQLFACAYCDKKYTEKRNLKFHLDAKHIDSRSKEAEIKVHKCAICGFQTLDKSIFRRHEKIHMAREDRQLFACTHCDKKYTRKYLLRRHLEHNHIDSRNADCTSSTDEVILDALKIEIDDVASPLDDSKNSEYLSVTHEIKLEDFIKTEPEDVAPIMKTEVHDD